MTALRRKGCIVSNHSGSYMLNGVLRLLDEASVFEQLGREGTRNLALKILDISWDHDCNPGEILEGIGERVGVCYICGDAADEFIDDECRECAEEYADQ